MQDAERGMELNEFEAVDEEELGDFEEDFPGQNKVRVGTLLRCGYLSARLSKNDKERHAQFAVLAYPVW